MSASVSRIFVSIYLSLNILIFVCSREEALQDVPDVEIESNWDQVVDK